MLLLLRATCARRAGPALKAAILSEQMGPGETLSDQHLLGSGGEMDRALFLAAHKSGSDRPLTRQRQPQTLPQGQLASAS